MKTNSTILHKSIFLILFIPLLFLQNLQAQVVTIGTGTLTQNYAPVNRYYNYSASEMIYLSSEIGAAGSITHLGFYKGSGSDVGSISGVSIYMKHTTSTTLATGTTSTTGYTLVYSGAFPNTSTSGWMTMNLSTAFSYNGTNNVQILVIKGYQSYTSSYPVYRYSTTTTRMRYYQNDNTAWSSTTSLTSSTSLPNIQITKAALPGCSAMTLPSNGASNFCNGSNIVTLGWNAPTTGGVPTGYKLYLGTSNTNPPNSIINGTNIGNVTSYLLPTNLSANTTYYWRIVPTNSVGDASCSSNFSFSTGAACTTITLGSGSTTSTDVQTPFTTYYHDARHQYLITAAELATAGLGAGNISALGFNISSVSSYLMSGFNIRMASVVNTGLTSSFAAPAFTTVYSGSYTVPGTGWRTIPFSTPFYWNGSSNVLVEVCFDNTGYTSSSQVYTQSTSHVSTTYAYADGSTGCSMAATGSVSSRPQMQILGAALVPPGCSALSTPGTGSTGVCYNGTGANLTWAAPTTGGVPTGYKIYFGTNNPPTSIQNGSNIGNTLSWNTNTLSANTTYYWRVVPTNVAGDAVSCTTVNSFTTAVSPCIIPNCASYTTPSNGASGQNANGINLTWTAPVGGGVPTGYKVYFGTNNPPTNLVNGTNIGNVLTWNTGPLSALTTYYWSIVPTNNTGDALSCQVYSFTSGNVYCTSGASNTADTRIGNVSIGSINNTSPTSCQTYTDYTNLSTNLTIGNSTSISVSQNSCGSSYGAYWSVWIDYNQDMDFSDPGELVGSYGSTNGLYSANSINFTVPVTALPGNTRMRVVLIEGTSTPSNPCGTYSWGETEDYTVNLVLPSPPACSNLSSPAQGSTGVCFNGGGPSLNWSASTGGGPLSGYKIYLGTNNPPSNLVNGTNVGNVLTWTTGALSASTTYYWRVVPTGVGGDASSCSVYSFTTAAVACMPPGCAASYTAPSNNASSLSVTGQNLSWTAPVTGGAPTGYKVYFGTNNPPTNIQNGTNIGLNLSWSTGFLSPYTTYYWQVVPTNGTGDATGCNTVYSFTTGPDYCTSYATSSADTRISNVSFGTVNNTSPNTCQTYTNYTNLSSSVVVGDPLTISVAQGSCGGSYGAYWSVFIDYNQDVDFNDPGEFVGSYGSTGGLFNANSINIIIPNTSLTGPTRLRVVLIEGGSTPTDPCATYSWGETEDYTLNILPPPAPSCASLYYTPVNSATNICPNNATISWAAATGVVTGYKLYLGTNNPPSNLVNGTDLGNVYNYLATTLSTSTTYYWKIVPTGPGGDASGCATNSFTTAGATCPLPNCISTYNTPANGAVNINSLSGIYLSWNTPSGPVPLGYKVYLGTNNPPTNLVNGQDIGNFTSIWFTQPQPNTTYYWRVVPYASGGDASGCTTVYSFSTGNGYCTNSYVYGTTDGDYLGRVNLGTLNNITTGSGSPYHTYYNALPAPQITQGSSQSLVVSPGTYSGNNYIGAWIDFNQNGVFEVSEKLGEVLITSTYPATGTISFTVPSCAISGFTRMRVREVYNTSNMDPCTGYSYGETEDYIVEILEAQVVPNCAILGTPNSGTTGVSLSGTSLNWTAPSGGACPTGYKLYFGTNNPPTNLLNGVQLGNVVTTSTGTLNPSTTYYWKIVTYNNTGDATGCTTVNSFTTCDLPVAQTASAATAITCNQFDANWSILSGTSSYLLDVATDNLFTQMLPGYSALNVGNVNTYTVSGLSIGTTYYYRVRGANACGLGTYSGVITVNTIPVPSVPSVSPGNNPVCQGFTANWSTVSFATSYLLTVATDNNFTNIVSGYTALNTGNVSSYLVTGLAPNTSYYYRVQAANSCGTSTASLTATGNTAPLPGIAILNSGTNPQCTSFDIAWSAAQNANTYSLDVANDSMFINILSGYNNLNVGNMLSASITGLNAGNNYYVRVRGVNTCGNGVNSVFESGSTLPVPAIPLASGATNVSCTNFDANWSAAGNTTQYRLDVATDNGFTSLVSGYNNLNVGNVTSYQVSGLNNGTAYYYRVKGENTCTVSAASGTVSQVTINLQDSVILSSNTPVCEAGSINLSAQSLSGATYMWQGPGGYSSILAQPVITNAQTVHSGQYSVIVSYSGCTDIIRQHSVLVNQPILAVNRSANLPLCSGETLSLTGSGGHTNSTYLWTGPNGFSSTNSHPQINSVTTLGSGMYTLSITSAGCNTMSDTLNVHIIPTALVTAGNNSPICQGDPLYIQVSAVPGSPYLWQGPNGYSTTIQNPSFSVATPQMSGVYTVTINQPGCNPLSYMTTVLVSPRNNVVLTSNSPVCTGNTLSLSATEVTGAVYSWSGPNGFTSSSRNISVSNADPSYSGQYTLSVANQGCTNQIRNLSVTVHPTLNVVAQSNSPVCQSGILYLNASSHVGATYQWSGPNGYNSNIVNPSMVNVQPLSAGTYTLTVNQPGCGIAVQNVAVTVSPGLNSVQVGSNTPICTGSGLDLSSTFLTGANYVWSGPNGYSSNQAVPNTITGVTTAASGAYTLTVSSPGCNTRQITTSVVVHPSLVLNPGSNSPVCDGSNLYLNGGTYTGATYNWSGPNGFTSTLASVSVNNVTTSYDGTYSLSVTQPGCGTQSTTVNVSVGANLANIGFGSNGPLCSGNNLILSAVSVSGVTYAWSGPNAFTSSIASNTINSATSVSSGIYTLTMSSPGCGSLIRNITGVVNDAVVLSAGAVNPTLCEGSILYLTSTSMTGGTYTWSGPGGYVSQAQNPSINPVALTHAGVYTVVSNQPGCGISSSTVSIAVGGSISGINGGSNSPVCVGGTLNLTSVNRSGVVYSWTGPNGFTSNQSSISFTNVLTNRAGNYSLGVSSPGCGSQGYAVKVVIHNPTGLSASNNTPICGGSIVYLNAVGTQGSTYSWSGPNGYVSNVQNPAIANAQAIQSGVYTLTINEPSCGAIQLTTNVQIGANLNNTLITTNSPVCIGGNLNLSATPVVGATYAWSGPNGFTSDIQNPVVSNVSNLEAGTYSVTISTVGCLPLTRLVTVNFNPPVASLPGSNSPVCQGTAVYLTSNSVSGATYSWAGPNGFVSNLANPSMVNVQPVSSGEYTLTISTAGCGSAVATTNLIIGGSLSSVVLNNNGPLCANNNLNLSSSLVSAGTIQWTAPDGFTSNLQNPVRLNAQTSNGGVYTFTASSPGCGTTQRTMSVIVNPALVLNAGSNSPVCQAGALMLSVNTITGGTYSWSGPSSFVSAVQNPSISNVQPVRSGVYTLTVNTSTCGSLSTTTNVVVGSSLSSLTVTANTPVCAGNNLNLTATNRAGFVYSWVGPNGFTSTSDQPVVSGISTLGAGRYSATITSAGCGSITVQSAAIVVNDPASVTATGPASVCVGQAIYFTGNAPTGSTFSWSGPMSFASTLKSPSRSNVQLSHGGVYTMNATVPGCGLVSATTTVNVVSCRVSETPEQDLTGSNWGNVESGNAESTVSGKSNAELSTDADYGSLVVWPNPNSGENIHLTWTGLNSEDRTITVRIFDATGKEVLLRSVKYDLSGYATESISFPVKLSKGFYTLETVHNNKFVYTKLWVE